jgi:anhydro-N-acetylmuramic acid kinase
MAVRFEPILALGLMSGTSMDGIDAALLITDGEGVADPGPSLGLPYEPSLTARLRAALKGEGDLGRLARDLTDAHAEAVRRLLAAAGLTPRDVALIGFHGHTIRHAPAEGITLQIGDGARLAEQLGIDVINDFRRADVAAGGQGAPLVPVYHACLTRPLERPLAVLNLGGVANLTFMPAGAADDETLLAFDTGPGNALLDDWALRHTGVPVDRDGRLAAAGHCDKACLVRLLEHPFFALAPPKSLDRNAFAAFALDLLEGLSPADGARTLVAFSAEAVGLALDHLPARPRRWLVGGGGRHNPVLLAALQHRLKVSVELVDAVGWSGDMLEAQAFAYLAVRSLRGLAYSFPGTTRAPGPLSGGTHHPHAD